MGVYSRNVFFSSTCFVNSRSPSVHEVSFIDQQSTFIDRHSLLTGNRRRTSLLYQSSIRPPPRKIFLHKESRESRQVQREKSHNYHQLGSLRYASWLLGRFRNIDEEYDRLVDHLHDCAKKAESLKTTKRRLSLETLELIRQRGAARAAGNQELTFELARLCKEAIKEDLRQRRAEVLAEAVEEGKKHLLCPSILRQSQDEDDCSPEPQGNNHIIYIASKRGMEKIIYFYSDLFDSYVHLPPHHLREDGRVIPEVLPSEIRHGIMSIRNRTAPGTTE
ncbi:hypothetical protein RB195_014395 [Necator americanus]|uniref:Uncharacterized protein n=1 Tax=Necator americanus TaxID=51031 RepID=A0ABR1E0E3_NECAM